MMPDASLVAAQLRRSLLSLEGGPCHGRVALGVAGADACLGGGVLRGALHEVFAGEGHGAAAIGFALGLAARIAAKKPLFWIRQDFSALEQGEISGTGLCEMGIDPRQVLVLNVGDATEGLRGMGDALGCASLGAVLLEISGLPRALDLTASRRLTLAAAHKGVTPILLRLDAKPEASAAETRWVVRSAPSSAAEDLTQDWGHARFDATLVRNRHGGLGRWIMEWDSDNDSFRSAEHNSATHPGRMAAAPFDRPHLAHPQELPVRRTG